jgi:vanillate monooxygenase ferredoxin subunit
MIADRFLLRVASREPLTEQIVQFELRDAADRELPPFEPGAHIEVDVRPGVVRRYSLVERSEDGCAYRIAVLRDPNSRGGSARIHARWKVGDLIDASMPRNNFAMASAESHAVLFAGGIGITPIISMMHGLIRQRRSFELHYAARSRSAMAYHDELAAETNGIVRLYPDDEAGTGLFDADRILSAAPREAHIYVCGPDGFTNAVVRAAASNGFRASQIHREAFSAAKARSGAEKGFSVSIRSSGKEIAIPTNRSIVETLEKHDIFIPSMCRQGICGLCATRVLSGDIDHRDDFLTPEERESRNLMLPCCSRAGSERLVLDL